MVAASSSRQAVGGAVEYDERNKETIKGLIVVPVPVLVLF